MAPCSFALTAAMHIYMLHLTLSQALENLLCLLHRVVTSHCVLTARGRAPLHADVA